MNQYHIRIDGVRSPDPYTYQELVNMGLFELDNDSMNGIEVKTTSNPNFSPLKSYCFPESQSNDSSYYIDEYGQIHIKHANKNSSNKGTDEYRQITSTNSHSPASGSSTRSGNSSPSSNNYSSSNGSTFFRIIGTIIVIGLVILIIAGTNATGTPIALGGYFALRAIWKDN